jgi:hypothetical protein
MSLFRIVEPVDAGAVVTATEPGIGELLVANVLTQDPRRVFRVADASALDIDVDLGPAPPDADTVGLIGATFSASGTWEWREAPTQGELTSAPTNTISGIAGRQSTRENPRGDWYHARVELPGTTRQRWRRISIADAPAGTWQVGRVLHGLGLQFPREYQGGWNEDFLSPDKLRTDAGVGSRGVGGPLRKRVNVQMSSVEESERVAFLDLLRRRGEDKEVWIFRDFTTEGKTTEDSVYGLLEDALGQGKAPAYRVTRTYSLRMSVLELTP